MNLALLIIDMINDYAGEDACTGPRLYSEASKIIPAIWSILKEIRNRKVPVIYISNRFAPDDFLFTGRIRPHALIGTNGGKIIDELQPQAGEPVIYKRRLSSFFDTNLATLLESIGVDTIALTGVGTNGCIVATAMDSLNYDLRSIILEDCCAAGDHDLHECLVAFWRDSLFYPLIRSITSERLVLELTGEK
jgi:nicotinamidase-related amidase